MAQFEKIMHAQKLLQKEIKSSKSQLSEQRFHETLSKDGVTVTMTLNGYFELLECNVSPSSTPFESAAPLLMDLHQLLIDAINLQMQRDIHRISNQLAQLNEDEDNGTQSH